MKTAVAPYRDWIQAARRWRAWIYRHAWRSALLVLLVLSLIEPLGCLAQCQLWWSFAGNTVSTAQQTHHRHNSGLAEDRAMVFADSLVVHHDHNAADAALLSATLGAPADLRAIDLATQGMGFLSEGKDIPLRSTNESSSVPSHEHLAALIIFTCVALVLLVQPVPRRSPPVAPLPAYRPSLRPPIILSA